MEIALIGNPNSGKTALFNELTGANQHVGNWPGVTVEQKRGQIRPLYGSGELVDLPGIYSLSPFSLEEIVSRDYLLESQPDVVINIIDATNLERNLYLSVQLIELNAPVVMALNMMDEVEAEGVRIDFERLSYDFGVPTVGISATQRTGIDDLMDALRSAKPSRRHELPNQHLEALITQMEVLLAGHLEREHQIGDAIAERYPLHWVAIKVLEGDELVMNHLTLDAPTMQAIDAYKAGFVAEHGPLTSAFADARYRLIHDIIYRGVTVWATDGSHHHHLKHAPAGYIHLPHDQTYSAGHPGGELFSEPHYDDPDDPKQGINLTARLGDEDVSTPTDSGSVAEGAATDADAQDADPAFTIASAAPAVGRRRRLRLGLRPHDSSAHDHHHGRGRRDRRGRHDRQQQASNSQRRSDAIDKVVTDRYLAIPIFLAVMFGVFHLTFSESLFGIEGLPGPGVFCQQLVEAGFAWLSVAVTAILGDGWLSRLLVEGVLGGVGTVLTFTPQILLLFFFLSLLEDCGYMARAAFVMDRFLRRFGLSGKSFLPMLMGFGCTVPAVMAARTMENPTDRRLTLMLVPFISCGARAPIYLVMASAFFPAIADLVIFGLYLLGILVAVVSGILLRKLLFKGESTPFIIELPRYRKPHAHSLAMRLTERLKDFLSRAGTVILAMCVVLWLLSNFGLTDGGLRMTSEEGSLLVAFGKMIAPVFKPLGFGFWIAAVAILTGFIAKESVISTLGALIGIGTSEAVGTGLSQAALTMAGFTPLSALSFMVFCLLYLPCVAAFATLKREFASWRWAIGQAAYSVAVAYFCALLVYQLGGLLVG